MHLPLSPDLTKALLAKNDKKLTKALAAEMLAQTEPLAMARYLLTPEVVIELLTKRLEKAPDATLRELEKLPPRSGKAARALPRPRVTKAKAVPKAKPAPKKGKTGKRLRLSTKEIDALKDAVHSYLGFHGWSTRKQISEGVGIPSASIYTRVMAELRESGKVIAKGEKAKRVHGLKGAGRSKPKAAPKKAAKSSAKKAPAAKRPPKLCPVRGCKNKAAPVFRMMCRDHKDLPKAERDKLFEARRERQG